MIKFINTNTTWIIEIIDDEVILNYNFQLLVHNSGKTWRVFKILQMLRPESASNEHYKPEVWKCL